MRPYTHLKVSTSLFFLLAALLCALAYHLG